MIEIKPHIPITGIGRNGKHYQGLLLAISDQLAKVSWPSTTTGEEATSIFEFSIKTESNQTRSFKVSATRPDVFEFDVTSHPQVQDLLHTFRKSQHIDICANQDVEHSERNHGFSAVQLPVVALPERSWNEMRTDTNFLGRFFGAPILITGMTGGVAQGTIINERLARAAMDHNIPMGVGSQRMALENDDHAEIFKVKKKFPGIFLIGNLGIGQLREKNFLDLCKKAVEMISADALAIHVNVLQELVQVEGDRDFRGLIERIGLVKSSLDVPLIIKEVGAGLDVQSAKRLAEVGVSNFDVGGSGGTSWALIEGLRASDPLIQRRGHIFRNWGIPTSKALADLRLAIPSANLIATGGIRDGLTALKAIYLGANMAGIGLPLMRAALEGPDNASKLLGAIIDELKIAKICSGL